MQITTSGIRRQLHELDEQIRRCREEIAAGPSGVAGPDSADSSWRADHDVALGALTARRIVTVQWL